MNILVLIAGVADPRWPLGSVALGADGRLIVRGEGKRVLSPFDESALELALKIRDAQPDLRISAIVLDGRDAEALLRAVAAFRLDAVLRLSGELPMWDARSAARQMQDALDAFDPAPDLLLIGREFGDCDEGGFGRCLAAELRRHFYGLVQDIVLENGELHLIREQTGSTQWLAVRTPALATVTNDRRNRLRHPLIKNVLAAKRAVFETLPLRPSSTPPMLVLRGVEAKRAPARAGECRMLTGSLDEQAVALCEWLQHWRGE